MTAHAVRVHDGRLLVGERSLPLISGEVQFWRMAPESWPGVLDRAAELGVVLISSYLSWRRHEPEEGRFRWGAEDPRLDVRRFLALCAERDLFVQLKPGPWICAEEPGGGYPDWLMARAEDLVLGAGGRPAGGYNDPFVHPVPSTHTEGYLRSATSWLDEFWREVSDLAYPAGPLVAIQLDNEPSITFQDAPYFADYHPAAIDRFRAWLADRYAGDVAAWHASWGSAASADFASAEPPRPELSPGVGVDLLGTVSRPTPWSRAALHDWEEFIEDSLIDHLATLRRVHDGNGMGHLLKTVNLIPNVVHEAPLRHGRIRERLGPRISVGVDHYYDPPMAWELVNCLARTAASARAAGEPVVWAPELMAGIWRSPGEDVTYPDPTPDEQAAWWGAAMALGYQGFNFYMLADRVNWELAPISDSGVVTDFAAPLARLRNLLAACPDLLSARPVPAVSVVCHRPDMLDAHTTVGTMRQPVVPWAEPRLRRAYDAWEAVTTALVRRGVAYDLWDTAGPSPASGTVVLVPRPSTLDPRAVDRLRESGCLVHEVPEGADPVRSLDLLPGVAIREQDGLGNAFGAVVIGPGGRRYLHLIRWGTDDPRPGSFVVPAAPEVAGWRCMPAGVSLARARDGGWVLPAFTGHLVYRAESDED